MSDPHSKAEIVEQLRAIQQGVGATVERIPAASFYRGSAELWSPCDYLKHLLLAVKPFGKAINFPPEQVTSMFGLPDHPSRRYADLVAFYQRRLDDGIRAEDFPNIVPTTYRMPDGIADVQAYLVQTWNDAHDKLFDGLAHWSEADLDTHQLPHAALGLITVREVLFFTIYHNTLHWNDIRAGADQPIAPTL